MKTVELIAIILGATGFWKLLEVLARNRYERKFRRAETKQLTAQTNSQIIDNYIEWSQKLEQRVKELESGNTEMKNTIKRQRNRIGELEKLVHQLELDNKTLTTKLETFKNART